MSAWDGRLNVVAYDEVEAMSNYPTQVELASYRGERLRRYEPYVRLFAELGVPAGGLRIVDVGSGSSAFLYALERAGMLRDGLGIELSTTRHAFAERWREEENFERVTNVRADFTRVGLEPSSYDRVTAIDETYLYLAPQDATYPARLLSVAYDALATGGMLVLDFRNDMPVAKTLPPRGREFQVALPATNAFETATYRQIPSPDGRLIRNESRYVGRDGTVREKVEITEVCDVRTLTDALSGVGFESVTTYGDLSRSPFEADDSPRAVIVARK
jgi:SAM-dependent methyltransferase